MSQEPPVHIISPSVSSEPSHYEQRDSPQFQPEFQPQPHHQRPQQPTPLAINFLPSQAPAEPQIPMTPIALAGSSIGMAPTGGPMPSVMHQTPPVMRMPWSRSSSRSSGMCMCMTPSGAPMGMAPILEVNLQNVVGSELHNTIVALGTLRNTDVLNITIPTHLADSITLCLPNVNFLVVVVAVAILLLELNSLVICLYPPGVLLHLFLDMNLDLLFHQQFAEGPTDTTPPTHRPLESPEHEPVIIKVPSHSVATIQRLRRVCLKKNPVLILLQ